MKRKKYRINGKKGRPSDSTKAKEKKCKCSNERGITLGSNMGKLFEIIMNNRLIKTVKITDAQAGGQNGKATADHLLILNNIIKQHKKNNKKEDLHIAFLDVTKAYDKAWLNAILYALNRSGLTGKDLNIVKIQTKTNSNNTNQIWKHKKNKNPGQHQTRGSTISNRIC